MVRPGEPGDSGGPGDNGSALAPLDASDFTFLAAAVSGAAVELSERALAHGLTVDEMERAMLESAMRQHGGNVSAAARQVGLTRRAFEYRLGRARNGLETDGEPA